MIDAVRQEVVTTTNMVVIKVGTNVLTCAEGTLNSDRFQQLADQIHRLVESGRHVALVSSGAVGAGVGRLQLAKRPTDLRHLQACAAIGQSFLMHAYENAFAKHGRTTAQILLTAGDFDHRVRYLNARNTINSLFEWGIVPIINENDTVSVDEIRWGDNDHLAASVTNLLRAPLLILLTSVDGLFPGEPGSTPDAQPLPTVPYIDEQILSMAGGSHSALGTGGMKSKLYAARLATSAGESVIVANGTTPDILDRIFKAEPVGTLFLPHGGTVPAWKRWLGYTARPQGDIVVDDGARKAVQQYGRSLLPIGILKTDGAFRKGDVVGLRDRDNVEFARGLTNYSAAEIDRIRGMRTDSIAELMGAVPYEEVVHRDNLAVII